MNSDSTNILHLSDIHFGKKHGFEDEKSKGLPSGSQGNLLSSIVKDSVKLNIRPDVVVVSGDLTSTANSDEFNIANAFLEEIKDTFSLKNEAV